jgi:hypothetical protein
MARPEEEWARRIVGLTLDADVEHNDDNSEPRMYDLRIGPVEAPAYAIEVTGAVDQIWTQTWNAGPGRSAIDLPVAGDYFVEIAPGAMVKTLKARLLEVLGEIESAGIDRSADRDLLDVLDPSWAEAIEAMGVTALHCSVPEGRGRIYLTMAGDGGVVDEHGSAVAEWVARFLTDEPRRDVLAKLAKASTAHRREVFVPVALKGAPWLVVSYLTGGIEHLPNDSPVLPRPIDGVWLAPTQWFREPYGVRWDGAAWSRFLVKGDGI